MVVTGVLSQFFRRLGGVERRRQPRLRAPSLKVEIDGIRYRTRDWSMSGFRIGHCHVPLKVGDRVSGLLRLPGRGGDGDFVAEVVWLAESGHAGLMLREVAPRTLMAMSAIAGY